MQSVVSILFLSECEDVIRSFHDKCMLGEGVISAYELARIMGISFEQAVDLMCGSPVQWIDNNLAEKSFADILADAVSRCAPPDSQNSSTVNGLAPFLYLYDSDNLYHIDNIKLKLSSIENMYIDGESLEIFLIIPGNAGELFRNVPSNYDDAGVRYQLNSHEGDRHRKPHVHLNYKHVASAVVDILTGDILEQSGGRFPGKRLKAAVQRVRDNKSDLIDAWNRQTDGLTINLNYKFGKTLLER